MKIETAKTIKDAELKKITDIPLDIIHAIEVKTSLAPPPMSKPPPGAVTLSKQNMAITDYPPGSVGSTPSKQIPPLDIRLEMPTMPVSQNQGWSDWWRTKFGKGKKYKSKKRLRKMYKNVQTFSKYKTVKIKKLKNNTKSNRKRYYK